jgi:hypothetical protein
MRGFVKVIVTRGEPSSSDHFPPTRPARPERQRECFLLTYADLEVCTYRQECPANQRLKLTLGAAHGTKCGSISCVSSTTTFLQRAGAA